MRPNTSGADATLSGVPGFLMFSGVVEGSGPVRGVTLSARARMMEVPDSEKGSKSMEGKLMCSEP
jgi:hypothetical protein